MKDRCENEDLTKQEIINANIAYHSALAETYDVEQSHFSEEAISRVEKIISDMSRKTGGGSLLDIGCGTGYIINIAKKHFKNIVGVDITPAMLKKVDTNFDECDIKLVLSNTESMPCGENEFDACVAHGFLHHLHDLRPTLIEAYRCLRPGGLFFSSQDPNRQYWDLMKKLQHREDLPEIVKREVESVLSISETIAADKNISPETVSAAEFQKVKKGGFDADEVASIMKEIGFKSVVARYEWFLGQGKVFHEQSPEDAFLIEAFLRDILPASGELFKYIDFCAEK